VKWPTTEVNSKLRLNKSAYAYSLPENLQLHSSYTVESSMSSEGHSY